MTVRDNPVHVHALQARPLARVGPAIPNVLQDTATQVVGRGMVDRNLDMSASKILGCAEDWMKLRRRERRQVLRFARQGKEHPNPRIARIAYGWALDIAPFDQDQRESGWGAATLIAFGVLLDVVGTLFGAALGGQGTGGALGGVLVERKKKRYAKKIISIRIGKSSL
jgi:hypothetical protein